MGLVKEQFAERVKAFRTKKGWTQEELAKRLGTTNATVSRWESLEYPDFPNDRNLRALAELMDAPDLFYVVKFEDNRQDKKHRKRIRDVAAEMVLDAGDSIQIGEHKIEMMPDGELLVNGSIRIQPPG